MLLPGTRVRHKRFKTEGVTIKNDGPPALRMWVVVVWADGDVSYEQRKDLEVLP
jgi:hypothetical protein